MICIREYYLKRVWESSKSVLVYVYILCIVDDLFIWIKNMNNE